MQKHDLRFIFFRHKNTFTHLKKHSAQILTKFRVIALVEEDLVADLLDDDVPGVDRARAAHDGGEDSVRGEHVAVALGKLWGGWRGFIAYISMLLHDTFHILLKISVENL